MAEKQGTASQPVSFRVAFQGERGAYSEQAAFELLGREGVECVPFVSFDDAFSATMSGETDMYLAPIENSLGGAVHANYDLQFQHNLFVIAEYELRVRHCLLALPGTKKEDVTKVMSHPQALAQCDAYIKALGVAREIGYDTAGSAKMVSQDKLVGTAAICSELSAEYYGLDVLDHGIEDDDTNWTRFILLRKEPVRVPFGMPCKTSIVFTLEDSAGSLFKALGCFSMRNIDLVKVESRPCKPHVIKKLERLSFSIGGCLLAPSLYNSPERSKSKDASERNAGAFRYLFYMDFLASLEDPNTMNALRNLQELTTFFRMLGCYPRGGTLVGLENLGLGSSLTSMVRMGAQAVKGPRPRVGLIGFGTFGQFLAKKLVLSYEVYATNRSNQSAAAGNMGVIWCESIEMLMEQRVEIIILAVSILSFEQQLRRLADCIQKRGEASSGSVLVVDVLSVKVHAKTSMLAILPESCDILCTHPMFGPESGKHGWTGLPFVFERVRLYNARRCEDHLQWWRDQGVRMVDMACDLHDDLAAGSQFVTHFTGRLLSQLAMRSTPINTKGYEALLQLVDGTCKDSFDLFFALYKFNPHSEEQLNAIEDAMHTVSSKLRESMSRQVSKDPGGPPVGSMDPLTVPPEATEDAVLQAFKQGAGAAAGSTVPPTG